jgi:hypothetical protein
MWKGVSCKQRVGKRYYAESKNKRGRFRLRLRLRVRVRLKKERMKRFKQKVRQDDLF